MSANDLYHDALLALAKDTSHSGRLEPCDGTARANNPLCGDRVTVDLTVRDGRIDQVAQKTRGCILTQAAAAMVARHASDYPLNTTSELRQQIGQYLKGDDTKLVWPEWEHFKPLRDVASRHDCVLIAFQALEDAARDAEDQEEPR